MVKENNPKSSWFKNLMYYIAGVISTIFVLFIIASANETGQLRGFTPLQEKGKCISGNRFTVLQSQQPGVALAYSGEDIFKGQVVLFLQDERLFYDNEVIRIPQGKCARQIGTYQYQNREQHWKTVPAVIVD